MGFVGVASEGLLEREGKLVERGMASSIDPFPHNLD